MDADEIHGPTDDGAGRGAGPDMGALEGFPALSLAGGGFLMITFSLVTLLPGTAAQPLADFAFIPLLVGIFLFIVSVPMLLALHRDPGRAWWTVVALVGAGGMAYVVWFVGSMTASASPGGWLWVPGPLAILPLAWLLHRRGHPISLAALLATSALLFAAVFISFEQATLRAAPGTIDPIWFDMVQIVLPVCVTSFGVAVMWLGVRLLPPRSAGPVAEPNAP